MLTGCRATAFPARANNSGMASVPAYGWCVPVERPDRQDNAGPVAERAHLEIGADVGQSRGGLDQIAGGQPRGDTLTGAAGHRDGAAETGHQDVRGPEIGFGSATRRF